jgi:hypothetical protein
MRIKEGYFPRCPETDCETPAKESLYFSVFVLSVSFEDIFIWDVVHVSRRYGAGQMELVESVVAQTQLLKVDDLNLYPLIGNYVSHSEVEDVLALSVEFSVGSGFSYFGCLFILLFCLLLFFDHSFNAHIAELSHKSVDTRVGTDRETVI